MSLSHNVFETVNSSLSLRQSSKHRNAWDERKFVFVFLFVFNGRLNFQIWHHKAKAPKSHPEGWCSLDCGRFRRGFNSFSFSITMPKKKKKKTRWNSARCKVYSISHFFPLQAQSEELRRRRKNPALFFFFLFSFISRTWCRGREGRGWETQQAPKKLVIINKNKEEKRKSKQNKKTHTQRMNTSSWTKEEEEKKYTGAWWPGSKVSYVLHEVSCSDLWPLCKSRVCVG